MGGGHRLRRSRRLAAGVCVLVAVQPAGAQVSPVATAALATPTVAPVALEDVPARAREITTLLSELEEGLRTTPEIAEIKQRLPATRERVNQLQVEAVQLLATNPSSATLDSLQVSWSEVGRTLESWQQVLNKRIREIEAMLARTRALQRVWEATREAARQQGAPKTIVDRASSTLGEISQVRKRIAAARDVLLLLQDQVAELLARRAGIQREMERARTHIVAQVRERDSPRLWEIGWEEGAAGDAAAQAAVSLSRQARALWDYTVASAVYAAGHVLLFCGLLVLLLRIRRQLRERSDRGPQVSRAAPIFELPASAAFVASTLAVAWVYPTPPRVFSQLLALAALVPALRILRRLIDASLLPVLYVLGAFFVFDRLRRLIDLSPEAAQLLLALQMAAGTAAIAWLMTTGRLFLTTYTRGTRISSILDSAARALIIVFGFCLVAAVLGYSRLAEWVGGGFLASSYLAIGIYSAYRVVQGLVAFALRAPAAARLKMTQHPVVERRVNSGLRWVGWTTWAAASLQGFDLLLPFASAVRSALTAELAFGDIGVSLGDLVAFALTVWAAFALSRLVRFVLEEDVFPRVEVARGVPYAITTLVHYGFLLVGFFLAFAAMGLDLNRFTILAGAFGVGIGFGMQNIVNNFVSGIILLFERPIQVGDTVQLGEMLGTVTRIGIRSSAVRTPQGAEIIVPNASFISDTVTNWTLSDRLRRIDVSVGVAYGTDPEQVLEILLRVAADHPLVLTEPPPAALFVRFGDSALEFELRAWTSRFDEWVRIRSELNVAVNAALREARIGIPFPQRDVHLDSAATIDVRILDK